MPQRHFHAGAETRVAVLHCCVLGLACLLAYLLATKVVSRAYFVSHEDPLMAGLWTVIATVFVFRQCYEQTTAAAVSRIAATAVSFALCLIYLIFLPFQAWGLAVLIAASALAVALIGRPGDAVTAAIATAVVLASAAVTPQQAWRLPILRFIDTVIGVVIGVAAAWAIRRVTDARVGKDPATPPAAAVPEHRPMA